MADIRQTPISQLPPLATAPSLSSPVVIVQGGVTYRTTVGDIIALAGGGGIEEAPENGVIHGRLNAAWEPIPIPAAYDNRGTATQSGGTLTIDLEGGLVRDFAASAPGANITAVTIANPPASGKEFRFSIYIPNVTTYTFTKPGNWSPVGQSDTAFTASKAHLIEAVSYNDGTTILFSMQEIP